MRCSFVRCGVCRVLREHYVVHHMNRFVQTLMDKTYLAALRMERDDGMRELSHLYKIRQALQDRRGIDGICDPCPLRAGLGVAQSVEGDDVFERAAARGARQKFFCGDG